MITIVACQHFQRAGNLARGALMAAALERCPIATAEHVRIASTEIL